MEAEVTFPRGAAPAKAKLVDLIKHSLKAAFDRITAMLTDARADKAARGGTFIVHYVLTVPAGWDELAKSVMRRAAEQAGEDGGILVPGCCSQLITSPPPSGLPAAHTSFALEPECAVLSALSSPYAVNLPPFGANLAIFDAGGGTTDCIVSTLQEGPSLKEVRACVWEGRTTLQEGPSLKEVRGLEDSDGSCCSCIMRLSPPIAGCARLLRRGWRV